MDDRKPSAPAPADAIADAQSSLAKVVARARAGEDRELNQKVKQGGEAIASVLAGLLKLSRVHTADNRAFDVPVEELSRAVAELVYHLGTVHLVAVEDQVYVNDVRVRSETLSGVKDLGAELARHNAGGLIFHAALEFDAVRGLVAAFAQPKRPDAGLRQSVQLDLVDRGITTVEVTPRFRYLDQEEDRDVVGDPGEALRRAVWAVETAYSNVADGRVLNPLPLRRSVAEILEIGPDSPALWEGPGEGLPHAAHAVNVTLLALLIGKAAGLRLGVLQDLGLAALVHDIGYSTIPADVARGPEGLARHPGDGARVMLRQRGFHVAKLRRLRAVLDHHRDHGDPRGMPSALGEILRLAEDYSTLLRVYGGRISPTDALGAMSRAAGRLYHPALMQVMINALGRYPPGTLLELDDGRLVRSVAPARSPETFASPLVRELDRQTKTLSGDRIDLAHGAVRRVLPG